MKFNIHVIQIAPVYLSDVPIIDYIVSTLVNHQDLLLLSTTVV